MIMTNRYIPTTGELVYLAKEYAQSCEALGTSMEIQLTTSTKFSNQGEPTYTRTGQWINGFCFIDDYIDKKTNWSKRWNIDNTESNDIKLNVPLIYYPVKDEILDSHGVGHLIKLTDDSNLLPKYGGIWIVEKNELSADRCYWILTIKPYRTRVDEQAIPSGIKSNFSLLKGGS